MNGVLNEVTETVHKHECGESDFQTACGAIATVSHDDLQMTAVEGATASRCGRCFDDAGGY